MSLQGVHPVLVASLRQMEQMVAGAGGVLTVTSGYRSEAEQARLYRRYLAGEPGLYNVAPPGRSAHGRGMAVDFYTEPRWMLEALGALWLGVGGVWGGDTDPVHFQLPRSMDAYYS